jgi:hypothetical protein
MDRYPSFLGIQKKLVACDAVYAAADCVTNSHSRVAEKKNESFQALGVGSAGPFGVFVKCCKDLDQLRVSEGHCGPILNFRGCEIEGGIVVDPLPALTEPEECSETLQFLEAGTRPVFPLRAECVERFEVEFL